MRRTLAVIRTVFPLLLFLVALWVLHHELRGVDWREVLAYLRGIPLVNLALALGVTVVSYFVLTLYDFAGTRYAREPLPYGTIAPVSFVAYAFTNSLGHPLLTGTPIRVRFYSVAGISGVGIARIVSFCFVGFWLGFSALGGLSLSIAPQAILDHLPLNSTLLRGLGVGLVALTAAYMVGSATVRRTFSFGDWEFHFPSFDQASAQLGISVADWALAATVPFLLLPHDTGEVTFFYVVTVFLIAHVAGLLSQVPGGIGVFETMVLVSLSEDIPRSTVLGALVVYRAIYYLVPLIFGVAVLAWSEFEQHRHRLTKGVEALGQVAPEFVPGAFSVASFAAGAILLVTGVTPGHPGDIAVLAGLVPLPVLEASHFIASVVGVGLLIIARGLQHRLTIALRLSAVLFGMGLIASILRGLDWGSAALMAILLVTIGIVRNDFYRKAHLSEARFTPGWSVSVLMVLAATVWLTFFAHKHVTFTNDLWLQFALDGDAARALRALIGVSLLSAIVSISLFLNPTSRVPREPDDEDMTDVDRIVASHPRSYAHLALLREKRILFHPNHDGFVMFRIERRTWVSYGDPIASKDDADELAWTFRDMVLRHGGWPVFMQVSERDLGRYVDMGLAVVRLGEEARVPLQDFDLESDRRVQLREGVERLESDGVRLEIIPPGSVDQVLTSVRQLSSEWLEARRGGEAQPFAFFDPLYVRSGPLATFVQGDRLVAFANLWLSGDGEEVMPDVVRQAPDNDPYALTVLFSSLMQWASEEGFRWFNLGMAPPEGIEPRRGSILWNQASNILYRHGEHFSDFRSLRAFKESFEPAWEPRFLASPGGLQLSMVMRDLTRLVAGSLRGSLGRGIEKIRPARNGR